MLPTNFEFHECDTRLCVPLFILDDDVGENPETITVSVKIGSPRHHRISFSSRTTQIEITDNDGKCCVSCKRLSMCVVILRCSGELEQLIYFARENRGSVIICAVLEEGQSVAFSFVVGFILRPDSASV